MRDQEFLKQFGKRMAEVRKEKGLTQEQLADLVDVHRTYIGFIEQGKRNPVIANIYKISKALKISLKELFSPFK
ncbi:MAG: helix-turn-helix domain-containing protein [Patescibacteria group bacterium]|nr:helix-turn-helix domain-containing protein [Patescibacteria group bacterium]